MNTNFRKATLFDFEDILLLKRQVHDFHFKNRPDFYKNTVSLFDKSEFENILKNNEIEIFVLEFNRKICGYAFVKIIKFKDNSLINDHDRFYIEDICIDKNLRKRGLGKFLMSELETVCRSKGLKHMDLTVWNFNEDALGFYTMFGMRQIMTRMEKEIE